MTRQQPEAREETVDRKTTRQARVYRLAQARALARARIAAGPNASEEEILSRLDRTPAGQIIPSDEDFEAVRDAA
ncbi:hypothetical protein [Nitrospira moscoviensis]|uniref:Uncharacterized protein n=1 Tax=Nitrospira moscoviensis TaxID=42253 RepID=A0A0K2GBG8_NITMO|nr:hypothetical protein [Nitrospira moscoviensis]ALA58316.1 hypothetical protein NITMOv2_1896 [Nitrospira moscoviensis]